jgi:hypothetical protein
MNKLLPVLLCLLLNIFAAVRATKPAHLHAADKEIPQETPTAQGADALEDEGEDVNGDDDSDAVDDQDTGDDNGEDDDGGGGDEGE